MSDIKIYCSMPFCQPVSFEQPMHKISWIWGGQRHSFQMSFEPKGWWSFLNEIIIIYKHYDLFSLLFLLKFLEKQEKSVSLIKIFLSFLKRNLISSSIINRMTFIYVLKGGRTADLRKLPENFYSIIMKSGNHCLATAE